MLSRVADSIYWMSRYIERAENVARFISVNLNLSLDMPGETGEQWRPLVVTTGDEDRIGGGWAMDDVRKRKDTPPSTAGKSSPTTGRWLPACGDCTP